MNPIKHLPVIGEILTYRPGGIYNANGSVEVKVTKVWPSVCEVVATSGAALKYQKPGQGLRVSIAQLYS